MTETTESTLATVDSRDGTKIGYWTSGQGPPLVLVHGMTADHTGGLRCCLTSSPNSQSSAALPNAQITVIDGQQHTEDVLAPEAFAELLTAFLGEEPRWTMAGSR